MTEWKLWYDERPTDTKVKYRWRLRNERKLCGKMLQPEWTAALQLCGMGWGPNEWWPEYSDWNGYVRSVPKDMEWRPMIESESEETIYHGFNLLPSPFTGLPPKVEGYGGYIGAGPWIIDKMGIKSYMVNSVGWHDANEMERMWNRRPNNEA